jgi:hypothetical protein
LNDFRFRPSASQATPIEVVRSDGQLRVVALHAFRRGERIFELEGMLSPKPSRFSVQVDADVHVEIPEHAEVDAEQILARYPWRCLNHACAPNARIVGRELRALRPIRAAEEITFDYETTEWDMASPFPCGCARCDGRMIRGFRYLSRAERERRRPWLAPHLLARIDAPVG